MINLSLTPHDFVSAIEGFAHGSHLRQHVWEEIVYKSIPQMSETDLDFFWFIFRRNLYDCYFYELEGKTVYARKPGSDHSILCVTAHEVTKEINI